MHRSHAHGAHVHIVQAGDTAAQHNSSRHRIKNGHVVAAHQIQRAYRGNNSQ